MGHGGDVIDELSADLREIEDLFTRIGGLAPGDERLRGLADRLTGELVRYAVTEEEYLFPAVRRFVDDGDDMADQELADRAETDRLIRELESCPPADARFTALVTSLGTATERLASERAGRLFPLLSESCPHRILAELGERVRASRVRPGQSPAPRPAGVLLGAGAGAAVPLPEGGEPDVRD
ncbi:hemerythrin domain-containing protein [Streptomyces sp. NPDC006984]|uniref:hemerythrin domain-containing protein n=1 Tax=Streptomyces sp. NPDC006984 TaxID=3155463 RepID=UPI0034024B10